MIRLAENEKLFAENALENGFNLFGNGRVRDLKKTKYGYVGAVLGQRYFEVELMLQDGLLTHTKCSCPIGLGRGKCAHMAAVLYGAAEQENPAGLRPSDRFRKKTGEAGRKVRETQASRVTGSAGRAEEADAGEAEKSGSEPKKTVRRGRPPKSPDGKTLKQLAEEKKQREKQEAEERERKRAEEEQKRAEEEQAREAEEIAERLLAEERERKRQARSARKDERKKRLEEQKRQAEQARRAALEKQRAEEARREAIRRQKEEEKRQKEEKRIAEEKMKEEMQKRAEARRLAEEKQRAAEEKKRAAAAKREEKRRQQERKEQEELERQLEEQRKEQERQQRLEEEKKAAWQEKKEREYSVLGGASAENGDGSEEDGLENGAETGTGNTEEAAEKNIELLSSYTFFDGNKIYASLGLKKKEKMEAEQILAQGKVELANIVTSYVQGDDELRGEIDVSVREGRNTFEVKTVFSRDTVRRVECGCPECRSRYLSYFGTCRCRYAAAAARVIQRYLSENNIGDATDTDGVRLLDRARFKRLSRAGQGNGAEGEREQVCLVPRLIQKGGTLSASFKVGSGRMFVVKNLEDFCRQVKNGETVAYGSSAKLSHREDSFTEESKPWLGFIGQIVREESRFADRMEESYRFYGKRLSVGANLELFGWRLDQFYELMGEETVEFENRDAAEKDKRALHRGQGNPQITVQIAEVKLDSSREFHGVQVSGKMPELYHGMKTAYFIRENEFCRVEPDFQEKIQMLEQIAVGGRFQLQIGRNHLADFYYKVLPGLEGAVTLEEENPRKFRSYLPPQAAYVFYLDAEDSDFQCVPMVRYGKKEYSLLETKKFRNQHVALPQLFRDMAEELGILGKAAEWFPYENEDGSALCCQEDEDLMYRVAEKGVDALLAMGEVQCTERFRSRNVFRRVKVAVGVSVSSGMLDLNITTDDVSPEELLDILNSYRQKKKYYQLKDGAFVNMNDENLAMLNELMTAMHLPPKEFIRGKMHLPVFRTLYLDKLLEENESVYSRRDAHFKQLVKSFKTVKDADFEEPESLSEIMRQYQKNGYRWLRTLEAWNFGGILADDMGLGKTLQMISVLLAAKEEGKGGTSLVVAPASLVFNWGEEFKRFAPQLSVTLVVGSQAERQEKLAAWEEADVLVTSYDLLKRDAPYYEDKTFRYQVLDEAQYIKNHTTAAAKAVKVIKSGTRFALTGTPIENRLSELWSIFDYLMPGFLYGYDAFRKEFELPIVKYKDEDAMKRLQRMTGPFILRRLKGDVLKDLPEKLEEVRYVKLEAEQRKVYDGQVVHLKEMLARQSNEDFNKSRMQIFAEMTRLRQLCCDPALCLDGYHGGAAKAEACIDLVESAIDGGHRILLFSQFTSMLAILREKLDQAGISYYEITGATAKEKRLELVKSFNEGDTPVFLISLKAGGVGLNLTGADVVIHYDPWWNLAAQNQATDRAHRIGQEKKVTVYKLIAKDTIEEKVLALQETKRDLAEQVIGGEAGQLAAMSKEEILELLEVK